MRDAAKVYDDFLNTTTVYYLFGIIKVAESVGYWDGSSLRVWVKPFMRIKHVTQRSKTDANSNK